MWEDLVENIMGVFLLCALLARGSRYSLWLYVNERGQKNGKIQWADGRNGKLGGRDEWRTRKSYFATSCFLYYCIPE
jgi:hypothetical protein